MTNEPTHHQRGTASLRKSETAEVRVTRSTWKGRKVVDIRIWYRPAGSDDFVPSRKGLTIDAGKEQELIALLQGAR